MRTTLFTLFVIGLILVGMPATAAEHTAAARQAEPLTPSPASDDQPQQWPSIAAVQVRKQITVDSVGCGGDTGEPCNNDWGDMGTGTGTGGSSDWGACVTNRVCSVNTIGTCYTATYGRCQIRLKGDGLPCQGC